MGGSDTFCKTNAFTWTPSGWWASLSVFCSAPQTIPLVLPATTAQRPKCSGTHSHKSCCLHARLSLTAHLSYWLRHSPWVSEKRGCFWQLVSPQWRAEKLGAGTRGHGAALPVTQLFCSGSSWSGRVSPCLPSCCPQAPGASSLFRALSQRQWQLCSPLMRTAWPLSSAQLIILKWARLPMRVSAFAACPCSWEYPVPKKPIKHSKKSYQCFWQDSNGTAGILKHFTCFPGEERQGQSSHSKASQGDECGNQPHRSATWK